MEHRGLARTADLLRLGLDLVDRLAPRQADEVAALAAALAIALEASLEAAVDPALTSRRRTYGTAAAGGALLLVGLLWCHGLRR